MFVDIVQLGCGLALLLGGGELLVRGAATLARCLGVAPLVVGLTVVSFGTSAPELAVNVAAAWRGASDIAFGNIMGSNMANIGLIVAFTALLKPLAVSSRIVVREIPMMILVTLVACVFAMDQVLADRPGLYDRGEGLVLLMLLAVFLYYTVSDVLAGRDEHIDHPPVGDSMRASIVRIVAGSIGLVIGAELTVDGGVGLAQEMGVPEVIVGLTLVAIGTSLPELAASAIAAYRGHPDLAIGNVVGSNIFNLVLVLGVAAIINPVSVPVGGYGDLAAVVVLSFVLWGTTFANPSRIVRLEGALLLVLYLAYMFWRA